jgi:arsenate reductase
MNQRTPSAKHRVLILCSGNRARSQMAEGLWRHSAGDRWDVFSAGTSPKVSVHPLAITVMGEIGIDIRAQRPKSTAAFVDQPFDLVLTVCSNAERACPAFPGARRREHWPFEDPADFPGDAETQLAVFRRVRDELRKRIADFVSKIAV